jgi:hypothetical protein
MVGHEDGRASWGELWDLDFVYYPVKWNRVYFCGGALNIADFALSTLWG